MYTRVDNIEVLVKCGIRGEETNVGYPVYTQIFRYTKRNNEVEYGFLIKHRDFVSTDYEHDGIVLTHSNKLSETYRELLKVLASEYGVDREVASRYLKDACR